MNKKDEQPLIASQGDHGHVADGRDPDGSTPLHHATSQKVVTMLIDNGASINAQNKHGATPLLALLTMYTQRKWGIFTPNESEIKNIVELLMNHGADVTLADNRGMTPLHEVARIDFNWLAWRAESALNFLKRQNIIIESGCSIDNITFKVVNAHEIPPGMIACNVPWEYRNYFETIDEYNDAFNLLNLLVDHGAHINAQTDIGITPFHIIVGRGTLKIINYFLTHGASINTHDNWGKTPVFYLMGRGNDEKSILKKLKLLIKHGADIMAKDKDSNTILHRACYFGHKEAIQLLLTHNHPINPQNKYGLTPLHQAVLGLLRSASDSWSPAMRYLEVIELLLNSNADVNAQNIYGWTAYQLITHEQYHTSFMHEVSTLLLAFGADKKLGQRMRFRAFELVKVLNF